MPPSGSEPDSGHRPRHPKRPRDINDEQSHSRRLSSSDSRYGRDLGRGADAPDFDGGERFGGDGPGEAPYDTGGTAVHAETG